MPFSFEKTFDVAVKTLSFGRASFSKTGEPSTPKTPVRRPPAAVVVAHSHPRLGQRIEWQHPRDFDSEGVEFKQLPSGFDACEQDFVFFRHHNLYALACFHRLQTESEQERNVSMRSVALFSADLAALQEAQLATQLLVHAKRLNASPEATLPLFDLFKPPAPPPAPAPDPRSPLAGRGGGQYLLGGGQLLSLVRQLRPRIFTLWKALLLGRRVLFYAPPPVGRLCERALCAHQLQLGWAGHPAPRTDLLLYVGLNDEHELLQRTPRGLSGGRAGYVACTTDRLLADKPDLWDLFIDDAGGVRVGPADMRALGLSSYDEARYRQLAQLIEDEQRRAHPRPASDAVVERFFKAESEALLNGVKALADEGVTEVAAKHLKRLHLGEGDSPFLKSLLEQQDLRLGVKIQRFRCGFCSLVGA